MIVLALIVLTFLLYIPNLYAFFQQDEWLAFSRLIILKHSEIGQVFSNVFTPTPGHYTPLNLFFILGEYLLFGLDFRGYIIVSIILHIVNVLLVYKLANVVTKNKITSFICAITFGFLVTTFQATSWVVANAGTHLATICTLSSLIFLFKFIDLKIKKYFILSVFFLTISLFFKEIAIANFVIWPLILFVFFGKKVDKKLLVMPMIVAFCFTFFKVLSVKLASSSGASGLIFDKNNFIYNFFSIPMKSLVQSVIPFGFLLDLSKKIGGLVIKFFGVNFIPGTWQYDVFIENTVFEVLIILIFIFIACAILTYIYKNWQKRATKIIFIFFTFSLLNGFVFGLSPEKLGRVSIIDSRDLYLLAVGSVFVLVLLLKEILSKKYAYVFVTVYLVVNAFLVINQTQKLIRVGVERQSILKIIKNNYPDLPNKVVFLFKSDKEYYGLGKKIMPFQSGLGQTLLVNYVESENYSHDFLRDQFLWPIESQGYKEINGAGFGYFNSEDELMSNMMEYRIEPQSIISYSWENQILINKTDEIREKLIKQIK